VPPLLMSTKLICTAYTLQELRYVQFFFCGLYVHHKGDLQRLRGIVSERTHDHSRGFEPGMRNPFSALGCSRRIEARTGALGFLARRGR
jgi:hypothetical protein